jgi:hypothetical protein
VQNDVEMTVFWMQCDEAQVQVYTEFHEEKHFTDKGMEDFAW